MSESIHDGSNIWAFELVLMTKNIGKLQHIVIEHINNAINTNNTLPLQLDLLPILDSPIYVHDDAFINIVENYQNMLKANYVYLRSDMPLNKYIFMINGLKNIINGLITEVLNDPERGLIEECKIILNDEQNRCLELVS